MLVLKRRPFQQKQTKSWDEAVKQYNLPASGIEVVIPGDYKPRPEEQKTNAPQTESPTANPATSKRSLRYIATRSLFLTCGLATLGNLPVYSMIKSDSSNDESALDLSAVPTSSPAQIVQDLHLPAVAVESFSGFAVDITPDARQGNWMMHTLKDDDDLIAILQRVDLANTAKQLLKDKNIAQELGDLEADGKLFVQTIDDSLQQLIYAPNGKKAYIVSVTDAGYSGKWDKQALQLQQSKVAYTVEHSVRRDGKTVGLSNSVLRQMIKIFRQDLNIDKHAKVGDRIGVIFEDYQYQGESIYSGQVLAAEYSNKGNTYQRVRFTLEGKTRYLRPDSDTELKRDMFARRPLQGGRLSSGFGFRRHPVLGLRKKHTGTDFAAPRGTPIYATADARVKSIGRKGGYGKTVVLSHGKGITTLYAHMSSFKKALNSGDKVKRGDVIGYVGSTGTSTGNHVHYEYRIDNVPFDPMTVKQPTQGIMTLEELKAFNKQTKAMLTALKDLRKLAKLKKPLKELNGG